VTPAELGACYTMTGLWVFCVLVRLARRPVLLEAAMLGFVWPLTLIAACVIVLQGMLRRD